MEQESAEKKECKNTIKWRTGISQAFWCHTNEEFHSSNTFEPATGIFKNEKSLSWFDYLLHGGIVVPDTSHNPLTLLLTGPPGAGKTTFALELIYRLINNEVSENVSSKTSNNLKIDNNLNYLDVPSSAVYVSVESTSNQIIDKVESFGWKNSSLFKPLLTNKSISEDNTSRSNKISVAKNLERPNQDKKILVYGIENIKNNGLLGITNQVMTAIKGKEKPFKKFYKSYVFFFTLIAILAAILNPRIFTFNIEANSLIQTIIFIGGLIALASLFVAYSLQFFYFLTKKLFDYCTQNPKRKIVASLRSFLSFVPSIKALAKHAKEKDIDILVVDSLNSLSSETSKQKAFSKFLASVQGKVKFVVFLLDSDRQSSQPKFWEYISDSVIRIDSEEQNQYWLRTIEISKMRYQEHVQGKQIFKIQPGLKDQEETVVDKNSSQSEVKKMLPRPSHCHPYRREGGLFILPSIHFYLSYYKRSLSEVHQKQKNNDTFGRKSKTSKSEVDNNYAPLYPNTLNELISANTTALIPKGRCTAFVGTRGGHKSHLGYLFQLHQMIVKNESSLVISLRDDEEMTRRTMIRILSQEAELIEKAYKNNFSELEKLDDESDLYKEYCDEFLNEDSIANLVQAKNILNWFESHGRLEILYYHPGYITPEEFCHRMFLSIKHIKHDGETGKILKNKEIVDLPNGNWGKLTVMFNSLDQLTARFPLCTRQDIFVPGLIDILNGEMITSIFIAVNTKDQPLDQYGLLPMADLILSFHSKVISSQDYFSNIGSYNNATFNVPNEYRNSKYEVVEVEIERFAGGQKAGSKGTLELINSSSHPLYNFYNKETGLKFNLERTENCRRNFERNNCNNNAIFNSTDIVITNRSDKGLLFVINKVYDLSNYYGRIIEIASSELPEPLKGKICWYRVEENSTSVGVELAS